MQAVRKKKAVRNGVDLTGGRGGVTRARGDGRDAQWELRVTRAGMPGRMAACARRGLRRTNIMTLGVKGRQGPLLETNLAMKSEEGT